MGSLAFAASELADRIFLGRHSESALAASLPGSMMASTFTVLLIAMIGYSGTFVAQFHGAGEKSKSVAALAQGLWLALFALPLFIAFIPIGNLLIGFNGHAPPVQADERTYFVSYVFVGFFSLISTVLGGYFSGLGRTRLVGVATAIGCAVNIGLDSILISGLDLGIAGSGIASTASFVTSAAILAAVALRDPVLRDHARSQMLGFHPALALRILKFGFPFGLSSLLANGTFALFTNVLGHFSSTVLAACNASFAIHTVIFYVLAALSGATRIKIGQLRGANDFNSIHRCLLVSLSLACTITLVIFLVILIRPPLILGLFASDPAPSASFLSIGTKFLVLMLFRDLLEAMQLVYTNALRAVGDTTFVLLARTITSVLVWTPAFLLAARASSPVWTWLTMPLAFAIHTAILSIRWHRGNWETIEIIRSSSNCR